MFCLIVSDFFCFAVYQLGLGETSQLNSASEREAEGRVNILFKTEKKKKCNKIHFHMLFHC